MPPPDCGPRPPDARCAACGRAGVPQQGSVAGYPLRRCPHCGLEFLWPQPDDATLDAIYGRHYYDAWGVDRDEAAVRALKLATFRRRLHGLRPALAPGARVLDVGCATGYFLDAARETGFEPFGVELSEFGAASCRERFGAGRIHRGELDDATFGDHPGGRFDAIFMSDLIEHVRDPARTLAAARRRLGPGGLLVITTPWTGSLSRRLAGRHWLHYKPEHLYYFGPDNLPRLLAAQGFVLTHREDAVKCLTLGYAATQFGAGTGRLRAAARLLDHLPQRVRNQPLWFRIGEATLVARLAPSAQDK